MSAQKVNFQNAEGISLSARLEMPVHQHPHTYAIFAHCFTCNKNLTAVRNISRALNQKGIAVLRFDFTGLGESEGEFADTNFSSNVEDLVSAAHYLATEHQAPELLIGHSLGGAAVICAGAQLESVTAIATVGAPFDPYHVTHHFGDKLMEINDDGEAEVSIGGRPFRVKKQFLENVREVFISEHLKNMRKALLVCHSPQDQIVEIENAAKLYKAAFHPKSFLSLDGADHLLSDKNDSLYAGDMIATWAQRFISKPDKEELGIQKEVAVRLGEKGYTTDVMVRHHGLTADEPESIGGNDFGPSPYELVSAGLGTCTAMTLQMYARRKKWDLKEVLVYLKHFKDYATDMSEMENKNSKIDHFERIIEIEGNLDETQRQRLLEIANRCPVHRTMESEIKVITKLKE